MIQSIPTMRDGVLFRSRLEARWSIFFDALGIEWEYEPDHDTVEIAYRMPLQYNPDFYLLGLDYWIEIKPTPPNDIEIAKMAGWAKLWQSAGFFIAYELGAPSATTESARRFWYSDRHKQVLWEPSHWWTECGICGAIDLTNKGDAPKGCVGRCYSDDELDDLCYDTGYAPIHSSYPYSPHSARILGAYDLALSARFTDSPQQRRAANAQLESERASRRLEAGLETYTTKKYGADWRYTEGESAVRKEFTEWLDRKSRGC